MSNLLKWWFGAISFCLVLSANATPLPDAPHIYVEGHAEVEAIADEMIISISIQQSDSELAKAKAEVDSRSGRLIELIKELGLNDNHIVTSALNIRPDYQYRGNDNEQSPPKTLVSRNVKIILDDLEKYPELMSALVEAKVSEMLSTELTVNDKEGLAEKAEMTALENARLHAERLAKAQGVTLGSPYSISQFYTRADNRHNYRPNADFSAKSSSMLMESSGGNEPFLPGRITISSQIYVVYYIGE